MPRVWFLADSACLPSGGVLRWDSTKTQGFSLILEYSLSNSTGSWPSVKTTVGILCALSFLDEKMLLLNVLQKPSQKERKKRGQCSSSVSPSCEIVYKGKRCPLNEHLGNNPNSSQEDMFKSTTDVWYRVLQPNMCCSLRLCTVVPLRHVNQYYLKYIGILSPGRSLKSDFLHIVEDE